MKKKIVLMLMCIGLIGGALVGCNKAGTSDVKEEKKVEETSKKSETKEKDETTTDELENLEDGTYNVSFKSEDFYEDGGKHMLQMDIYTYDKYSKEEIEGLAVGDKIAICGEDVAIKKIEKEDDSIYINGGHLEGGDDGYYFTLMEDGTYEAGNGSPCNLFYISRNAALPLASGTVTYIDESDYDNKELVDKKSEELGAFIKEESKDVGFVPENTIVTVQDGCVVVIKREYMQ